MTNTPDNIRNMWEQAAMRESVWRDDEENNPMFAPPKEPPKEPAEKAAEMLAKFQAKGAARKAAAAKKLADFKASLAQTAENAQKDDYRGVGG